MQKNIVIPGFTLTAAPTPSTLTVALTPVDNPALKCTAASQSVQIKGLLVTCICSGVFGPGTTFATTGTPSGTILASTPRVQCEGQSVLTEGDSVTITCPGIVTTTAGGATSPGTATVQVTVANAGQLTVNANKV